MSKKHKINIMIMAGTKDAANIIKKLSDAGEFNILATTTTEYGGNIAKLAGANEVISTGLTEEEIIEIIKAKEINILVDATHPFAAAATRNAIKSSKIAGIKYLRFERPNEDFKKNDLIHEVFSFEEAALKLFELTRSKQGNILHLAGVSTLKYITEKVNHDRIFARVLPSLDSVQKCFDLGLKQENIIAMQGIFSKEFNRALMEEYNISFIITKESGETGGTMAKIDAALKLEVHIIIVMRPEIQELDDKEVFNDIDKLYNNLIK